MAELTAEPSVVLQADGASLQAGVDWPALQVWPAVQLTTPVTPHAHAAAFVAVSSILVHEARAAHVLDEARHVSPLLHVDVPQVQG